METADTLGRRRNPAQNRGLRPLFPKLPPDTQSRVLRVAMARVAWARLDAMVDGAPGVTMPRAVGQLIEAMLERADFVGKTESAPAKGIADWQSWQKRKELALLSAARGISASEAGVLN